MAKAPAPIRWKSRRFLKTSPWASTIIFPLVPPKRKSHKANQRLDVLIMYENIHKMLCLFLWERPILRLTRRLTRCDPPASSPEIRRLLGKPCPQEWSPAQSRSSKEKTFQGGSTRAGGGRSSRAPLKSSHSKDRRGPRLPSPTRPGTTGRPEGRRLNKHQRGKNEVKKEDH